MQTLIMWVSCSIDQISSFGRWPVPAGQLVVGEASSRYWGFESGEGVLYLFLSVAYGDFYQIIQSTGNLGSFRYLGALGHKLSVNPVP